MLERRIGFGELKNVRIRFRILSTCNRFLLERKFITKKGHEKKHKKKREKGENEIQLHPYITEIKPLLESQSHLLSLFWNMITFPLSSRNQWY